MKKAVFVTVFLPLLPLMFVAAGCSDEKQHQAAEVPTVTGVTVEKVSTAPRADFFSAPGTVRAAVTAPMAARIAGMVEGVHVHDGERVARGRLLVTIRSEETASAASGAEAGVEEAARGVEEAEARKKLAEDTYARFENLFKEQAVTRQEFDTRRTERDVAVQGLARAEARLKQAREQANAAGAMEGYTRIKAPFTGIVTGKVVERGATVFPGMPLLNVEEEGKYRFEASVPDTLSDKLRNGDTVSVTVDGVEGEIRGRIAEIAPVADPVTRTRLLKIDLEAKGLRSGVFGRATLPAGTGTGMSVPRKAIVERGMLTSVWVVNADSSARMRLVKTGRVGGGRVEIISGLAAGERIVTAGVEKVTEGARIR